MSSARVWVRGLFQKTVWSRFNMSKIPSRFQLLYTLVLPFKYFMLALYGAMSIGVPISSIDLIFGGIYGDLWSDGLMIAGILAFLGVIFYDRLLWVEVVGAVFLVTLMVLYVGCIFTAALVGAESFRLLSFLLVMVFLPMPSWRILDIVRELRPPRHVS